LGAFSVIDLLLLNGLTIITEFIGISLGLQLTLGIPQTPSARRRRAS
jgi:Mn2+/Fe2+ NRAMP family transporter